MERWPETAAASKAFHTAGPATPSAIMPRSFSNAITAPLVISPDAPGAHMPRSESGTLPYRHVKLPAGG
jgi:hypothetical protein